jgi:peptide/nickel transport system permease protein
MQMRDHAQPAEDETPELADLESDLSRPRSRGQFALFLRRLRRDRLTMTAAAICAVVLAGGITSPLLQQLGVIDPTSFNKDQLSGIGSLPSGAWGGISWTHPMGLEPGTGRDLFSRVVSGLTVSLSVGTLASFVSILLGTVLGLIAGFSRGRADWFISRLIDLVLSFPTLLMLLTLAPVLVELIQTKLHLPDGPPTQVAFMVLVLGAFGWPYPARIVRGQVLSIREREFVEAATSLGAGRFQLYFREVLPHLAAPLLICATLVIPQYIAAEATLGFLGLGIQAPTASLGSILNDSVAYAAVMPSYFLFPGLTLALIVLGFNLLGDGLRDVLDPKGNQAR